MALSPIHIDLADINLNDAFNIGNACTQPEISQFDDTQTAIIVDHEDGRTDELSYRDLNARSNQFAHALEGLQIGKGERVMLWLPNIAEFPITFFGTLKLGAIAVPTSIMLTPEEIQFLAKDSGAKVLVTTRALFNKLSNCHLENSQLEHIYLVDNSEPPNLAKCSVSLLAHDLRSKANSNLPCSTIYNDPAYLVYTSGTTGYPKGVLHAHRALPGRLPAARHWFDYAQEQTDRILHSGKFNWTYVLGTALMDPLFLGKTVVVYEGASSAEVWPKLIAKHKATIFIGVPTIYRQIVQKTHFTYADVPSLRHCMSAGEHLSDEMLEAWKQRFDLNIYEAIGMSECSYYLSQHPTKPIRPGSAGFPQPGHKVALLNDAMQEVADEEEGMLAIHESDMGLFIEYWQLPDITQASRAEGYFLTGDYAKRDKQGYIWFLGRKDDIINSFGFRISPMEIERVLKTHPQVADCVALEESIDADKSIATVCVIATEADSQKADASEAPPLNEEALLSFASKHLATYKVPKRVVFMKSFPRTANGKVLRKSLKAQLAQAG